MMDDVECLWCFSGCCLAINVEESTDGGRPDSYIDMELVRECYDLSIVSVGAASGHNVKAEVEGSVDVGLARWSRIEIFAKSTSILPLWVPSNTSSWIGNDESLEHGRVLAHVVNCGCSKLAVVALITKHLIGQGVEETVSFSSVSDAAIH